MKLEFALFLLISLCSYCECRGVGGRVVGSGGGRGGKVNTIKVRGSGRRNKGWTYGSDSGERKKTSFQNLKR